MIPLQLTLKNFLSYRDAVLDFRGLHTACICGANGAGKSSLLEAITWAIWGESRVSIGDDVIHAGTDYTRVDFEFSYGAEIYKIIRSRHRGGKASGLDFQVINNHSFRPLSGKSIKDTQEQINTYLKLDHKTFVNSAYLRQGQADEFMKQAPSGRKQILAELLQLDRYESLAIKAKDLSKQFEGQTLQIEQQLEVINLRLEERNSYQEHLRELIREIAKVNQEQERDHLRLQQLQGEENQRHNWQKQLHWQREQQQSLSAEIERLAREKSSLEKQLEQISMILNRKSEIVTAHDRLLNLDQKAESLSSQLQAWQQAQYDKQQLEQKLQQKINEFTLPIQQTNARLEELQRQEKENQKILNQTGDIQAGLEKLNYHRQRLQELEQLALKSNPLTTRKTNLNIQLEREKAHINARLEQQQKNRQQLQIEIARIPQLRNEALSLAIQIKELDKKQVYYQRVEEKEDLKQGDKKSLLNRQKNYEELLLELADKLERLNIPDSVCPLCEQNLDSHHRHQVITKTHQHQEQIQEQIWSLQEQMANCDRELKKLQQELTQIKQELQNKSTLQQKYVQLEVKLENIEEKEIELERTEQILEELESLLNSGSYALELQQELQIVNQQIALLNYDEQSHALVIGEEKRWRWAEIQESELKQANRRLASINGEKPNLINKLARLEQEKRELSQSSPLKQEIESLEKSIQELNYDRTEHQNIQNLIRQLQGVRLQYQDLQQAERNYPEIETKISDIQQRLQVRNEDHQKMSQELENISQKIDAFTDYRQEISSLSTNIQRRRQTIDGLLSQKGRVEEKLNQLETLANQLTEKQTDLAQIKKQYRVYQELTKAFGKNGLQTLMIENVLPELEAQTNHILARLTGNQFHVQFLTQKAGKGSKKQRQKLIDTLDIIISDTRGSRPYETYSGGEAFRINFSIRLALARLLAQRAGTALQMLIVDEGFGTQDAEGCDRLIAAINAISSDFACILTVTHMPQFKEAFQHRIEVRKTEQGSQLMLLS
jgi:DNA repair protein SbcC/Rad50